jgi:hypothetical protein
VNPLDRPYLEWLYRQVDYPDTEDTSQTFWKLFEQLYNSEALWLVPHDDNRLQDGKDLRQKFAETLPEPIDDPEWMGLECSVLELIIGLAYRMFYEDAMGRPTEYWFWKLLENLKLERCTDRSRFSKRRVDDTIKRVLHREYETDGDGGFFPLKHPDGDQRDVELWYQLCAYMLEQNS